MSQDYSWVTNEMFDAKLMELLERMSPGELMSISGIYEALVEELNNQILDELRDEREEEEGDE